MGVRSGSLAALLIGAVAAVLSGDAGAANPDIESGLQAFLAGEIEPDVVSITYSDLHGLHGGLELTIRGSGRTEQQSLRSEAGEPGELSAGDVHRLVQLLLELRAWEQRTPDRPAVPDESRARLRIQVGDGTSETWEWFNEMEANRRLIRVRDLMTDLAWVDAEGWPTGLNLSAPGY